MRRAAAWHEQSAVQPAWRARARAPHAGTCARALAAVLVAALARAAWLGAAPCAAGTYQPGAGQSACLTCPASSFCPLASSAPVLAPAGSWAAAGSGAPVPCGAGTAGGAAGGALAAAACPPCPPGAYCARPGLTAPTGLCAPGYACFGNATTPTPTDGATGAPAPPGGFALTGAAAVAPCPAGTYANVTGATSQTACRPCPPRYYCAAAARAPTGLSGAHPLRCRVPREV